MAQPLREPFEVTGANELAGVEHLAVKRQEVEVKVDSHGTIIGFPTAGNVSGITFSPLRDRTMTSVKITI
jgi:hypothetical protein